MGFWAGVVVGFIIAFIGFCFVAASGSANKEYEAYMEGFNEGLKANKNKEKEVE